MEELEGFLDTLNNHGLEGFRVFYGEYRALVTRNDDPEKRGRIQVKIPEFSTKKAIEIWIEPQMGQVGQNRGTFNPPEVNDAVWVRFDRGRSDAPMSYTGGYLFKGDVPPELEPDEDNVPNRRGLITRMGHLFIADDTEGQEAITFIWHRAADDDPARSDPSKAADRSKGDFQMFRFDNSGALWTNKNGAFIQMDADNNQLKLVSPRSPGGAADQILFSPSGISVVDASGKSLIQMGDGNTTVVSEKGVVVQATDVTVEASGVNLASGPRERVFMGERYTNARATMNTELSSFFSVVGGLAQSTAATMSGISVVPVVGTVASGLVPFFQGLSIASNKAGAAIQAFEASKDLYMSKKTRTG